MSAEPERMLVVDVDPLSDPRWDDYIQRHPEAVVYQHSGWLRALRAEYGRAPIGLAAVTPGSAELRGVLPLMWTARLPLPASMGGPRLASLPRTPVAGPLGDDAEAVAALLAEAARRAEARRHGRLQVKPSSEVTGAPLKAHPWRETYVIELPANAGEELRFGSSRNHARIRWAVNKAAKSGVRVRLATGEHDVRAWYPLHLEALRVHAVPPRPLRLFLAMWRTMAPAGLMRLYLAENRAGRMLAGSIVLAHNATAFYAFNGVRRAALALRPNDVIQWEAIHEAARDGRRHYDLGEVVEHQAGLADFKRKWGARSQRLIRLYDPPPAEAPDPGNGSSRLHSAFEQTWRRLPLPATAALGALGYRFL